jgi:hypothetical protein
MDTLKMESMDYPCKKLGGIAHVNAEYFYKKDRRFFTGFECDRATDCGISRSPFSGTFNYTLQCPLYIALTNNSI